MNPLAYLPFADRDDEYHLASIRCAHVRQELGGVKAAESSLFLDALDVLLHRGWTVGRILDRLEVVRSPADRQGFEPFEYTERS